jgi:dCTP deaminase
MILTDREIEAALATGQARIEPGPLPKAFSSSSIDLTLDPQLQIWQNSVLAGVDQVIDPAHPAYRYMPVAAQLTRREVIGDDGFILGPGAFVLAWTRETIALPTASRLASRVEGKSSLARLGLAVHVTAPTIHAGFEGQVQLEICNHGPLRVRLRHGMRVCQVIFEQTLGTPNIGYSGQFLRQHA